MPFERVVNGLFKVSLFRSLKVSHHVLMTGSFHAFLSEFSPKRVTVAPHVDDHTVMKQAVQE